MKPDYIKVTKEYFKIEGVIRNVHGVQTEKHYGDIIVRTKYINDNHWSYHEYKTEAIISNLIYGEVKHNNNMIVYRENAEEGWLNL